MAQVASTSSDKPNHKFLFIAGIVAIFCIVMAVLGGMPPESERPFFLLGIILLVGLVFAFALAVWHLLIRPLPANHKVPESAAFSVSQRRLYAILLIIAALNFIVGAFWDEVWHREYGLPFGEDLLWRPHLLIYSSFAITVVLALYGLYILMSKGKGTLQQRFRANPVIGLLVLAGAFFLVVTPADPLWHIIYGEDISAWSLPHIVLLISFIGSMMLAVAIQMTTLPLTPWQYIWQMSRAQLMNYLVVLFAFALALQTPLQLLVTEWDGLNPIIYERPDWLLPTVLIILATFFGTAVIHATRFVGAGTVTALLAIAMRLLLLEIFNYPVMVANAWYCVLGPIVALDVVYGIWLSRTKAVPAFWLAGLASLIGMVLFTLPLMNQLYSHPQITMSNVLPMLLIGVVVAIGAAWIGQSLGDYLGTANKQLATEEETISYPRYLPPVLLLGVIAFIYLFVATASVPV